MSFAARETSQYSGEPQELYWFANNLVNYYYTSGDQSIVYASQIYQPEAIHRSDVVQSQELKSGSMKITIPKTNPVAALWYAYAPTSPIYLTIFRFHVGDSETQIYFQGRISQVTFGDECEITIVANQDLLKKTVPPQRYQPQCNWVVYGPGCGVDKSLFRTTTTIAALSTTASTNDTISSSAFAAHPDGYYTNGLAEDGDEKRMIIAHTGSTIQLDAPFVSVNVGDTIKAYRGCQRNPTDCNNAFNNLVNFWGFPWIPPRNPFDSLT